MNNMKTTNKLRCQIYEMQNKTKTFVKRNCLFVFDIWKAEDKKAVAFPSTHSTTALSLEFSSMSLSFLSLQTHKIINLLLFTSLVPESEPPILLLFLSKMASKLAFTLTSPRRPFSSLIQRPFNPVSSSSSARVQSFNFNGRQFCLRRRLSVLVPTKATADQEG